MKVRVLYKIIVTSTRLSPDRVNQQYIYAQNL